MKRAKFSSTVRCLKTPKHVLIITLLLLGASSFIVLEVISNQRLQNEKHTINLIRDFLSIQRLHHGKTKSYLNKTSDFVVHYPIVLSHGSPFDLSFVNWETEARYGYLLSTLTVSPPTDKALASYSAIFIPSVRKGLFRTGNDCFYLDQTGVIRHSGSPTKIPNANSPPVE